MHKKLFIIGLMLVSLLTLSLFVAAVPATIDSVEIDNDDLNPSSTNSVRSIDKGESFDVKVHFTALQDEDDVQVSAYIRGFDSSDRVEDTTSVFDITAGNSYTKKLKLDFPKKLDQDRYKLRVEVASRDGSTLTETYDLDIETARHDVVVWDVVFSPNNGVKAGRALLTTVNLRNFGDQDEDNVKVTVSIPELGVSAVDYLDELEEDGQDDTETTEEIFMRIPQCAQAGLYEVDIEVRYHDLDRVSRETRTVEILADPSCHGAADDKPSTGGSMKGGKTVISVGPEAQDVVKGSSGAIYPLTITNVGQGAMTYTVSVNGGDWGSFRVSPSSVTTVGTDETKTVYVYATANQNAVAGAQSFGVTISSGDKELKTVGLNANVVDSSVNAGGLKRALEIGLIVLVVILVILGLIIGFNKLKGDDEDREEGQSYY